MGVRVVIGWSAKNDDRAPRQIFPVGTGIGTRLQEMSSMTYVSGSTYFSSVHGTYVYKYAYLFNQVDAHTHARTHTQTSEIWVWNIGVDLDRGNVLVWK